MMSLSTLLGSTGISVGSRGLLDFISYRWFTDSVVCAKRFLGLRAVLRSNRRISGYGVIEWVDDVQW
jgi:hypothetical protein